MENNNTLDAQELIDMLLEEIKILTQDKVINKVLVKNYKREVNEKIQIINQISIELESYRNKENQEN